MTLCAVTTCKLKKDSLPEGIYFHPFPKDEDMREKWVDMTGRESSWIPKKSDFICSRHFRENDYIVKRSGRRYLKTSAIPCEYVVYRLYDLSEEESSENEPSNKAEVKTEPEETPADEEQAPMEVEEVTVAKTEPEPYQVDEQPGTSRDYVPPMGAARSHEADSTMYFNDTASNAPWENIQPRRYFGHRLPLSLFEESSQEMESSGFDERFLRDVGSALNPYPPVDLGPHLQELPLPRTPEPEMLDEDTQESVSTVKYKRSKAKLESIKKIVSGRKSSRKLIAAAMAVVDEAESLKIKLQTGLMNDHDKATAVIALQNKQIAKLNVIYKKLRKKLKKISAVLRKEYKNDGWKQFLPVSWIWDRSL